MLICSLHPNFRISARMKKCDNFDYLIFNLKVNNKRKFFQNIPSDIFVNFWINFGILKNLLKTFVRLYVEIIRNSFIHRGIVFIRTFKICFRFV